MKHINLQDCAVRESVHLGELFIHHIAGNINCADIFTKEIKTASHFCLLRDSFMMDQRTFDAAYYFSFSLFGLAGMGGVHLYFVRPVSQVQTIVVSQ